MAVRSMYGFIHATSRPARGAWVEIMPRLAGTGSSWSRPARGAWVEIGTLAASPSLRLSRPARGAWVEMSTGEQITFCFVRRAPQGARGLKFQFPHDAIIDALVAPRKGRVG